MTEWIKSSAFVGGSVDEDGNCRRWAPRRRCRWPAFVKSQERYEQQRCHVVDHSSTGARLELACGAIIVAAPGHELWLAMPTENLQVRCRVVWIDRGHIGVSFLSPMQALAPLRQTAISASRAEAGRKAQSGLRRFAAMR